MLCHRAEADPDICGRKLQKHGLCFHEFCLFFANGLCQHRVEELGLLGFLPEDVRRTVDWAAQKHCFVCGESGATITCWETGCERSFHLPCAMEGGCVTQFFFQYRSFCWEHRPEQAVEAAPEANTTCLICLEPVGDKKTHGILVCPACKHAWFHRGCIQVGVLLSPQATAGAQHRRASLRLLIFLLQGQAVRDGIAGFRCPLCRDRDAFPSEMLTMGIRIPFSLPSRDSHADEALLARHSRCDASGCLCPGGRQQADGEGPWELLLCSSCAAEGTHRHCSSLSSSTASWECDSCAGPSTASSATSELAGPSTTGQAASASSST
ncbi:E3 ubiquitin-protein ligase PHF7 isoform X1 [Larus michahellis]|uniref:E3 ubiquitin-protein ligase PHF7 isoform X1 n=1 Tax=Larus michahellis TaxID=119627 RepID=UPI003D9AF23A